MASKYNHKKIEAKWQKFWLAKKTFVAKDFAKKPKKYVLIEFPYPSGEGLHMGHLRPYVAGDVYSRYLRLQGNEVMYPMGWDAFGLPAENYAIKNGVHPSVSTKKNVANAKKQVNSWGISFDWSREVNTTDPNYYKWTQWIFLKFMKAGLAYEATGLINWCPKDKTGLANEEVVDGKCERCGTVVEKKELRQWYLKITAYAEKLLEGLKTLKWPQQIKLQQENWIGKSVGAEIDFTLAMDAPKNCLVVHGLSGSSKENWFPWIKNVLEKENLRVTVPDLPGAGHPTVSGWNEILSGLTKDFEENSVLIGHSIGVPAVLNLVQSTNKKVNKLILVGPVNPNQHWKELKIAYSDLDWEAVKQFAEIKLDWKKIMSLVKEIVFYYSDNDKYIPPETVDYYKKYLPNAVFRFFPGKGHFNKSAGVVKFPEVLNDISPKIKVFTTRPDTIFGATYMVLAPEHPLVENIKSQITNYKEVQGYIEEAKKKTDIQRSALEKEKTGVELKGVKAINPATGEKITMWVADYILMGYGTGAIMAVPQHDERDRQFAEKYNLPIVDKPLIPIPEAIKKFGQPKIQYKLRDWVFSRQRYWGEPIPIIHCPKCGIVPVPEKDLPVKLPNVKNYEPTGTGESPLAVIDSWVNVKCPNCKTPAKRETNTMPQWAGSSWYWLRYCDPKNKKEFASIKKLKYWQPVDVYFGGMEHTTLHLLYSRFWNQFLFDQGLATEKEPYVLRQPHGIVLAADGEKMSKSRGNVVNPDVIVKKYGADTLRMYELFLGPHEAQVSWNDQGVVGVKRFLDRVWYWVNQNAAKPKDSEKLLRELNKLTKKVTEDFENFRFNTSISAFMEFYNEVKDEPISIASFKTFLILLYPFASHLCEELNQLLGNKKSLQEEKWPTFDPKLVVEDMVEIVIQINGKLKGRALLARDLPQDKVQAEAVKLEVIKKALAGVSVKRVIFVPNKLINLVM